MTGRVHWLGFCETGSGTTSVRVFREGKELLLLVLLFIFVSFSFHFQLVELS